MDLYAKFSDSTSSMCFYAAFALQHPVSSAADVKLWNRFVSCIKDQLPSKNTPAIIFFPYTLIQFQQSH